MPTKHRRRLSNRRRTNIAYPQQSSPVAPNARITQFPRWARNLFQSYRYKVAYGGRGAARSWSFARAILIRCAQSHTRVLCTREIQSSLKDSVHQLLRDQIELLFGIQQTQFIVTDREIRHVNGSLILFAGLRNNVQKIKSIEAIDICWVEEAERVSKESWRVLIPTIRKPGSEIWVSFNPDQEEDATWQRFVAKSPPRSWCIKVNADENPWFPDALREERDYDYAVDPEAADWVWGGNLRTANDAQIFRGKWTIEDFEVPYVQEIEGDPTSRLIPLWHGPYQGMDFGFASDPTAAIRCWIYDSTLYLEHEAYGLGVEIDATPTFITSRIAGFEHYRTRADSSRPDSISYLRRHGLDKVRAAIKGANSIEDGIAHIRHFKRVVIHSRCIHAKTEFKLYSYKVDPHSGDVLPIVVDKHNHIIDALRYALEPMMKKRLKVGLLFAGIDGKTKPICRVCHSFLPDDGQCVHCGYNESLDLNSQPEVEAVASTPEPIIPMPSNGNGNGNGHSPTPSRWKFRGING